MAVTSLMGLGYTGETVAETVVASPSHSERHLLSGRGYKRNLDEGHVVNTKSTLLYTGGEDDAKRVWEEVDDGAKEDLSHLYWDEDNAKELPACSLADTRESGSTYVITWLDGEDTVQECPSVSYPGAIINVALDEEDAILVPETPDRLPRGTYIKEGSLRPHPTEEFAAEDPATSYPDEIDKVTTGCASLQSHEEKCDVDGDVVTRLARTLYSGEEWDDIGHVVYDKDNYANRGHTTEILGAVKAAGATLAPSPQIYGQRIGKKNTRNTVDGWINICSTYLLKFLFKLGKGANRLLFSKCILLAYFTLPGVQAAALNKVQLDLQIEDPCWHYKSQDPVFMCTVSSMEWAIRWRQNWEVIAILGHPVGEEHSFYNMSTMSGEPRQEKLQLSGKITERVLKDGSAFVCENQGYQSQPLTLQIPDCRECEACSTSTFADVKIISEEDLSDDEMLPAPQSTSDDVILITAIIVLGILVMIVLVVCFICVRRHTDSVKSILQKPWRLIKKICVNRPDSSKPDSSKENMLKTVPDVGLGQ